MDLHLLQPSVSVVSKWMCIMAIAASVFTVFACLLSFDVGHLTDDKSTRCCSTGSVLPQDNS